MTKIAKNYKPTNKEKFMNAKMKEYFKQKLIIWKNELLGFIVNIKLRITSHIVWRFFFLCYITALIFKWIIYRKLNSHNWVFPCTSL